MRSDKELLQEALTALQIFGDTIPGNSVIVKKAINNIGERLAESEDEPFCYVALGTNSDDQLYWDKQQAMDDGYAFVEPVYRRPPRQPVRLSDEKIREIFISNGFTIKDGHSDLKSYVFNAARAIEKAVFEKNK